MIQLVYFLDILKGTVEMCYEIETEFFLGNVEESFFFFFAVALRPKAGHGLLILEVSRSHTTTHHSR